MADIGQKFGLTAGGPYGFKFPGFHTNMSYGCPFADAGGGTLNTTATRLYYSPFFVGAAVTFTRCYTQNQGAGDNGEVYRTGAYANDGASGPGTLISDFGEVTLTGATALRTQTISLDLSAYVGQWIWLAQHHNSEVAMYDQKIPVTAPYWPQAMALFGSRIVTHFDAANAIAFFRFVDTAYGALASTAVAPSSVQVAAVPVIKLSKV
jgi:hypothetical protein